MALSSPRKTISGAPGSALAKEDRYVPRQRAMSMTHGRRRSDRSESESTVPDRDSFIKVVARVRPMLPHEEDNDDEDGVEVGVDGHTLVLTDGREQKQFAVDQVFDSRLPTGSQAYLFKQFGREFVQQSLKGYNVCIFAYGHTGSGKTYTMLGDGLSLHHDMASIDEEENSNTGLLPRFLHEIFAAHTQDEAGVKARGRYVCEFYEVYNETIKDLLAPGTKGADRTRKVHVHPKHGVRIENLTFNVVSSAEEALGLVQLGTQMRTVAATTMNERSSRSHAIFTFKFELQDPHSASTVTFVDLAGREDQSASKNQALQFREMCFINTSLFHLTHVITKLSEGQLDRGSLSDFRNSKLTLLLAQALTGSSKTALIATLAPVQTFFEDTVSTLNFAQSVKKIQTRPVVNKHSKTSLAELEAEVKNLQKELSESKTSEVEKEQELLAAQSHINYYRKKWEEVVFKSEEIKAARKVAVERLGLQDPSTPGVTPCVSPQGEVVSFFTKLCDDPSLQGYCNFFLKEKSLRIGSNDRACDIVLHGLGITPQMCEVHLTEEGGVQVELASPSNGSKSMNPRVLVNGQTLRYGDRPSQTMEHGDCIVLGYSHAFRLVVPTQQAMLSEGSSDPKVLARALLPSLDLASVVSDTVDETGGVVKELLPFIRHLSARSSESEVQSFMRAVKAIRPLLDEANLITNEIFGNRCRFELHALTDFCHYEQDVPELVVCVVDTTSEGGCMTKLSTLGRKVLSQRGFRAPSPTGVASNTLGEGSKSRSLGDGTKSRGFGTTSVDPSLFGGRRVSQCVDIEEHMTAGGKPLLYHWSVEKFLWRLNAIRDVYQEGCENKDNFTGVRHRIATKPFLDPWRETTFDDIKLLAEIAQNSSLAMLTRHILMPQVASGGVTPESQHSQMMPWLLPRSEEDLDMSRPSSRAPSPLDWSGIIPSAASESPEEKVSPGPLVPQLQLPSEMTTSLSAQEAMTSEGSAVEYGIARFEEVRRAAAAVEKAMAMAKRPSKDIGSPDDEDELQRSTARSASDGDGQQGVLKGSLRIPEQGDLKRGKRRSVGWGDADAAATIHEITSGVGSQPVATSDARRVSEPFLEVADPNSSFLEQVMHKDHSFGENSNSSGGQFPPNLSESFVIADGPGRSELSSAAALAADPSAPEEADIVQGPVVQKVIREYGNAVLVLVQEVEELKKEVMSRDRELQTAHEERDRLAEILKGLSQQIPEREVNHAPQSPLTSSQRVHLAPASPVVTLQPVAALPDGQLTWHSPHVPGLEGLPRFAVPVRRAPSRSPSHSKSPSRHASPPPVVARQRAARSASLRRTMPARTTPAALLSARSQQFGVRVASPSRQRPSAAQASSATVVGISPSLAWSRGGSQSMRTSRTASSALWGHTTPPPGYQAAAPVVRTPRSAVTQWPTEPQVSACSSPAVPPAWMAGAPPTVFQQERAPHHMQLAFGDALGSSIPSAPSTARSVATIAGRPAHGLPHATPPTPCWQPVVPAEDADPKPS